MASPQCAADLFDGLPELPDRVFADGQLAVQLGVLGGEPAVFLPEPLLVEVEPADCLRQRVQRFGGALLPGGFGLAPGGGILPQFAERAGGFGQSGAEARRSGR